MVPLKRRKVSGGTPADPDHPGAGTPTKFPEVVLFLLEKKLGSSRRAFLSQLGRKNGFPVESSFSERVTHVISENISGEEVRSWLDSQGNSQGSAPRRATPHLLDISWFTESMGAGRPVQIQDRHKLKQQQQNKDEAEVAVFSVSSYACQRETSLDNHNTSLTEALSLLAENAELSDQDGRGVSFRRAAAVLKALPEPVSSVTQLRGLPCLGEHSLIIIRDVLENGESSEVEGVKQSERFKALKVLTGVFGVGPKTADRWIREGISTLDQLKDSGHALNRAQQAGVEHYDDLNLPVSKAEADEVTRIVEEAVNSVLPGGRVTLTGGFRRGKLQGHDVDFLITHPDEGKEEGLMPKIVSWLELQGFLLYQKTTRNSYVESQSEPALPSSNMDRFERCFSIFKLEKGEIQEGPVDRKSWRALRVDLVVSPISQFAFALLGWTGSKLFERELRRWAGREKGMSLNSHALYDNKQRKYLRASSEQDIFAHLGLDFVGPTERNA